MKTNALPGWVTEEGQNIHSNTPKRIIMPVFPRQAGQKARYVFTPAVFGNSFVILLYYYGVVKD